MKKFIAVILSLSVLFSFSASAHAVDSIDAYDTTMINDNLVLAYEKATAFLNDFDSSLRVTLSDPIILYNVQQEAEAVSFTINGTGYIIVNLESMRVPEFSLKRSSPFINRDAKYIYNGPVSYYEAISSTEIRSLNSGEVIEASTFATRYNETAADRVAETDVARSALPEDRTDENPSLWETDHFAV